MGPSSTVGRHHDDSSHSSSSMMVTSSLSSTASATPETAAHAHNGTNGAGSQLEAADQPQLSASQRELDLQRKRARDRKSQQAMRDRTKWTINTLSEQVAVLSTALDQRTRDVAALEAKMGYLETENAQLRTQNAALQLSLLGRDGDDQASEIHAGHSPGSTVSLPSPLWELHPKNTPPSCIADQILQGFVDTIRAGGTLTGVPSSPREKAKKFPLKPNLFSLLDEKHRPDDDISNVVADVVRTYREIEGLPKQVAVFYLIATLLKVCLDP